MRPKELIALGELAGEAAAGTANHIRDMHESIATRVWTAVGPMAEPVRIAHDRIASGAYSFAGALTRALVRESARALSAVQAPDAPSIERSVAGRTVVGALNGAFGDRLERTDNALTLSMTLRRGGRDVELTRDGLRRAYPDATPRLAVFVHGLCETDDAWMMAAARHVPYGFRLQAELGYTPLYVRYNTGLHISENGREFARLLDAVISAWPTEVHEIALIGHSMGGLVARSGCHYGPDCEWCGKVRHVFTLGSPHRGAPLERATNAASVALAQIPETRGFAKALNARSVGIKDLRYGYLTDECWLDQDCDSFLRDTSREVPFLKTASHYFVCATLSREPDALVGRMVGDLLVLKPSAWSDDTRGQRLRFEIDHYHHVGGANHFDLLNHPAIYTQISRWLIGQRALPAPAGA
jgi:pimeloyl-ACP methyl ester carboxylesterase